MNIIFKALTILIVVLLIVNVGVALFDSKGQFIGTQGILKIFADAPHFGTDWLNTFFNGIDVNLAGDTMQLTSIYVINFFSRLVGTGLFLLQGVVQLLTYAMYFFTAFIG